MLQNGNYFCSFKHRRKTSVIKESQSKSANCFKISFFLEERVFYKVYVLGQKPHKSWERIWYWLFLLYQYVSEILHYYFHIEDSLKNVYVNILWFYSFSYRGKVIIKGVSNAIEVGHSITLIKGEYNCYTGCCSF